MQELFVSYYVNVNVEENFEPVYRVVIKDDQFEPALEIIVQKQQYKVIEHKALEKQKLDAIMQRYTHEFISEKEFPTTIAEYLLHHQTPETQLNRDENFGQEIFSCDLNAYDFF